MTADRLYPRLLFARFGLLVLTIYAIELLVVRSSLFPLNAELAAGAVAFDLVVCVPALFYLLVVRTKRLPAISIVPIFLLSLLGASFVLPTEHEWPVDLMWHMVLPAELLLAGYIGVRAYRGIRNRAFARADTRVDLVEHLRSVLRGLLPVPAVASAMAYEMTLLYYAFFSWCSRPDVREGELAFSYHEKNGYSGVLVGLALVVVVEMLPVHLLIQRLSTTLAWVLTAMSLYGVVWVLGQLQAVRLRPILLTPDSLQVRVGLLWNVRVPYHRIARVVRPAGRDVPARSTTGYLHAVTLGMPQLLLELRGPVDVHGLYGYTKRGVVRIGIAVDQRDRFAAELAARVDAASDDMRPALPGEPEAI